VTSCFASLKVVLVRRILLATLAATSLVLAGCGGDSDGAASLDSIKVSAGASPKVTVPKDFTATKTASKTIKAGSGDTLKTDDLVKLNYVAVNGRTAGEFDNSYKAKTPLTVTLNETSVLPGFIKGLKGKKIGSRVLVAIPPKDGFNAAQEQLKLKKTDTMVFLFDVVSKVPTEASGKAKKLPADVPQITYDKNDHPVGFKTTSKTEKKVTKQSIDVVVQGSGATITKGQTVTTQYVGAKYADGKVFDESWTTAPRPNQVGVGALYPCWDEQLVGQKLGSRVVLVCPPDKAFGDNAPPTGVDKKDPVIFVIDLLDAS
jgi:peptidylprolyl isomerase